MNNIHPSMFSYFLRVVFLIFVWRGEGWKGGGLWVVLSLKRTLYQRLFSANQNNQRAPFVSGLVLVPSDLLTLDFPLLEETVCCLPLLHNQAL